MEPKWTSARSMDLSATSPPELEAGLAMSALIHAHDIEKSKAVVLHTYEIACPRTGDSQQSLIDHQWDQYINSKVKLVVVPELPARRFSFAYFRSQVFTVYHRLFSIVFAANLTALIWYLTQQPTAQMLLRIAVLNLVICGLARLPVVINTMYILTCWIPVWAPLRLRRLAARMSHYGGVHSGCGISSLAWYNCYIIKSTKDCIEAPIVSSATIAASVLAYIVLLLLVITVLAAYPVFRHIKHDVFELTHRFSAWILVVLFWITYFVMATQSTAQRATLGRDLVADATFWLAVVLTLVVITPWITLRKVPVQAQPLSSHAVRLHFRYAKPHLFQGINIARHPLKDWHSFATVPAHDRESFSVIISKAGDWTSDVIARPPTKLYKRATPSYSFARSITLFRRVVLLATGSGIGPCLSCISTEYVPPLRLIWQTRNPSKTYGSTVMDEVHQLDSDAIIIDSDEHGRRDLVQVAYSAMLDFRAEALLVVSNPAVTKLIVYELEARGMPAYGAIFDS